MLIYLCIHVYEFANLGPNQILDNGNPRKSFTFDSENFGDTVDFAVDKLLSHTKSACKTVATCNKDQMIIGNRTVNKFCYQSTTKITDARY